MTEPVWWRIEVDARLRDGPAGSQEKSDLEVFNNLAEEIRTLVEANPEYRRIIQDGGVVVETW